MQYIGIYGYILKKCNPTKSQFRGSNFGFGTNGKSKPNLGGDIHSFINAWQGQGWKKENQELIT